MRAARNSPMMELVDLLTHGEIKMEFFASNMLPLLKTRTVHSFLMSWSVKLGIGSMRSGRNAVEIRDVLGTSSCLIAR